ncbi:MAG: polysaccharide deacetylase family protein [Methanomassiliicoccales archaeon]|nr:polysaccharide deacetylase family protein [Methanomassiliicoccales archaeon]
MTMGCATITIDVDRDVNLPEHGRIEGISRARDGDKAPRFESAAKGLKLIVSVLNDLGIKGTFFIEAETAKKIAERMNIKELLKPHEIACHGYRHEDLTGEQSGIKLSDEQVSSILDDSVATIKEVFNRKPVGFRAPYLHIDNRILAALAQKGFMYDSSIIKRLDRGEIYPYRIYGALIEAPIASGVDRAGKKIVSYLWPLHEGQRKVSDYEHFISRFSAGLFILATHSWHLIESYDSGLLPEEKIAENVSWLRSILKTAIDLGIEFCTVEEYLLGKAGD